MLERCIKDAMKVYIDNDNKDGTNENANLEEKHNDVIDMDLEDRL